jgi:hypothetical protein
MSDESTTRRKFLGNTMKAAIGVAAVSGASLAGAGIAFGRAPRSPSAGILREVGLVRPFSGDWRVTAVYGPIAGGITLTIRNGPEGRSVRVDISRRDVEVKAPAFTKHLELFVMDGGGGVREMPDDLMVALGDLASILEDSEDDPRVLKGLMTFSERLERYPEFMARAACELEPTAP